MNDLADALIAAAGTVIREKHDVDQQADFATLLVATDRKGTLKTHRFDIANRRNGTAESKAAVACRAGADRFLALEIGTTDASLSTAPDGPSFHWVFLSTKTKNVAKDEALRDRLALAAIDHPAVDRFLLAFTGHTRLPERRITLKPVE